MAQFTLTHEIKVEDGYTKIRVFPSNSELSDKLESYLNVIESNQTLINNFISEQTTLLFNELQNSDLPNKENYTL